MRPRLPEASQGQVVEQAFHEAALPRLQASEELICTSYVVTAGIETISSATTG
jgi:hypothetical protein